MSKMKPWQLATIAGLCLVAICVCGVAGTLLLTPAPQPPTLPPPSATPTMTFSPTLTPTPQPTRTPTPGLSKEEVEYLEVVQEALDATNLTWENMQRLLDQLRDDFDYWIADPDWCAEMAANLLVPSIYYTELRDNVSVPAAFADAHQNLVIGWEHWDRAAKLVLEGFNLWMQGEDDEGKIEASVPEIEQGHEAVLRGIEEIERVKAAR